MHTVSSSLNICLVTSAYPPTVDGFATYTRDLAVSLASLGQSVTVLCADRHDVSVSTQVEYYDCGVRVIRLSPRLNMAEKMLSAITGLVQLAQSYKIYAALRRYHSEVPFDVIEFSNWHAPAAIHSLFKLAPQILRVSTTLRSVSSRELDSMRGMKVTHKERVALRKLTLLEAFSLRRSDFIVAPNQGHWRVAAADYLIDSQREQRMAIIPLGIDVSCQRSSYSPRSDNRLCRLLFLGRLTYRKGFDLFMRALPEIIASANTDVYVTIIGEDVCGPDGASTWKSVSSGLDEGTRQRVEYLGVVTDQERNEHYRRADVFVGPSRYESFGLMYVEAMSYAVPVVGTRVGGIPEVIEDSVTGLLVEPDNARILANAVLRLVNDEELRRRMGEAAKASVLRRFTREGMALAMLEVYRSVRSGAESRHLS
jgi:glycogen(starch) synthase